MTCGQVGHKYKMVFKLITIFMEAERIILFNLTELTCDQLEHKLKRATSSQVGMKLKELQLQDNLS